MIIGYARCSSIEQKLDRQIDALKDAGCERTYEEKITGTTKDRPELSRMLDSLRAGDVVIICDLTRLSRSAKDLFDIVEQIRNSGADIKSLKESWLDTTTPQGRFMFTISAGLAEFERELIVQRTKEGLAAARARGRCGGRPKVNDDVMKDAITLYESKKYSIAEITRRTGIGKSTLYKYVSTGAYEPLTTQKLKVLKNSQHRSNQENV